MKYRFFILSFFLFVGVSSYSQQAFLVRQTMSSIGSSESIQNSSGEYLVQQSIGQQSVSGSGQGELNSLRQGFIQAPLGNNAVIKVSELNISSFPNPFSEFVIVDFLDENIDEVSITISDGLGRSVLELFENVSYGNDQLKIEAGFLSSGTYFIQVISGKRFYTTKLIKQ